MAADMTSGGTSRAEATAAAFTAAPGTTTGLSLSEAYAKWKAGQGGVERNLSPLQKARLVGATEVERRALRRGAKRVGKKLSEGKAPAAAIAAGHRRYRKSGGTCSMAAFVRKLKVATQ